MATLMSIFSPLYSFGFLNNNTRVQTKKPNYFEKIIFRYFLPNT